MGHDAFGKDTRYMGAREGAEGLPLGLLTRWIACLITLRGGKRGPFLFPHESQVMSYTRYTAAFYLLSGFARKLPISQEETKKGSNTSLQSFFFIWLPSNTTRREEPGWI